MKRRVILLISIALLTTWNSLALTQNQPAPRVSAEKLQAAVADADGVFVGKFVEADLTDGFFPGYYGIHAKRVVYEATEAVKGKPAEKVVMWFMLFPGETSECLAPPVPNTAPKLDPKLFAKGSVHLVCSLTEKQAVGKWKQAIGFVYGAGPAGDRVFGLTCTADVADAKAAAKKQLEAK